MQIPYGIQSYRRLDVPQVVLRNLFVEKAQSVPGQLILVPRPSLAEYTSIGSGPINGLHYQGGSFSGTVFSVSGSQLYAGSTLVGDVKATGRVKFAVADTVLMIATGGPLYTYNGTTLAKASFPDDADVSDVLYMAAYAVAVRKDTRRIYFTLDPTTWDALNYVSAQQSTANIVGMAIVVDQIWLFCEDHTEIFYATGDSTAPFQRVQGRVFDKGAISRDSIVRMDNTVIWVGHDGVVYRGEGAPVRISDHGIEERIAASDRSNISAWSFPWKGHLFYVLRTDEGTFAYDAATQQWSEFSSYGKPYWGAFLGVNKDGTILAGGGENSVWQLTGDTHQDADGPIVREFTILLNDNVIIDNLAIDCSVAQGPLAISPESVAELRTSRDSGATWTDWRQCSMGSLGANRTYCRWRRLGFVDEGNMVIQIRISDPVLSRVSYVRLNENTAGRSR